MRYAFGLTGVLVMLGLAMWIFNSIEYPTLQQARPARQQAQQLAGQTDQGRRYQDTYLLTQHTRPDGKLNDLQITRLDTDSPLLANFHAQLGDAIVAIIDSHEYKQEMRDFPTPRDGEDQVLMACTQGGKLIVNRGGSILLLPDGTSAANLVHLSSTTPPPPPPPQPATPQPTPQPPAASSNPGDKGDQPTENDPLNGIRQRLKSLPGQ